VSTTAAAAWLVRCVGRRAWALDAPEEVDAKLVVFFVIAEAVGSVVTAGGERPGRQLHLVRWRFALGLARVAAPRATCQAQWTWSQHPRASNGGAA
jgi:hypothetical protein